LVIYGIGDVMHCDITTKIGVYKEITVTVGGVLWRSRMSVANKQTVTSYVVFGLLGFVVNNSGLCRK
jgi:hypothetical protein